MGIKNTTEFRITLIEWLLDYLNGLMTNTILSNKLKNLLEMKSSNYLKNLSTDLNQLVYLLDHDKYTGNKVKEIIDNLLQKLSSRDK